MSKYPRYLTVEEALKLIETPYQTPQGRRDRLYIQLLLSTGLRRAESLRVRPLDISIEHRELHVVQGKGGKDRVVPIHPNLAGELHKYAEWQHIEPDQPIFPYSLNWGSVMVRTYAERAGLKHIHPHTLRHTYAVQSIRAGRDVVTLQHDLGHSNLSTTSIYLQMTAEDRKRVHTEKPLPWEG